MKPNDLKNLLDALRISLITQSLKNLTYDQMILIYTETAIK